MSTAMRKVRHGERLSGHRRRGETDPGIVVSDGIGAGSGALMFAIESFHWADVVIHDNTTELWFENRTRVVVHGGVVEYVEPQPKPGPEAVPSPNLRLFPGSPAEPG